jgi:hypothetical protein
MRKAMVEEIDGVFVVSCFSNGLFVEEMTFPSHEQAQHYATLYAASNWKLSNSPSSLSIH